MQLENMKPVVRFAASVRNGVMDVPVKVTDCRIFFVEEGSAWIHIDGKSCLLEKNGMFYCCGGSTYRVERRGDLQVLCLNFDLTDAHIGENLPLPVSTVPEQWGDVAEFYDPVEDSHFLSSYLLLQDADWMGDYLRELVEVYEAKTQLGRLLSSTLLKALLLRLHGSFRREMPPKLRQVQAYIRANYRQPLTNKQLAELVGYHEYYLNRIFSACTGMRLHEYVMTVRMEQAAYLIMNTELPLSAVAEEVGIRSYPHFSACFKDYYGCAPTKYRKKDPA